MFEICRIRYVLYSLSVLTNSLSLSRADFFLKKILRRPSVLQPQSWSAGIRHKREGYIIPDDDLSRFMEQASNEKRRLRTFFSTIVHLSIKCHSHSYFLFPKFKACFLANSSTSFLPCSAMNGLITFCT